MPVRYNRHYNDPALGAAFSNLAQAFGPPDSADIVNYTNANAKREEATRLAQLFDYSQSDDYDQSRFDRMWVATGGRPDQSYYSVDQGNATQRYGYDTQAATSRANNAADNDRAMREAILRQATDPVSEGAIRPGFNPADYGVGRVPAVPEFAGRNKPLNESEWQAQQSERLRTEGKLSDELMIDRIMGDKTPVQAIGPDNKPRFMSPGEAVRTGAAPYDKPSAERVDNYLAIGPNGEEKRFVGYLGPDNRVYDVETRQPVPNVMRKESTGGGMSFETDGQGGIKLSTGNAAGNTTASVTDLQRQEREAGRAVAELSSLFDVLRPDDLGIGGNINEMLTDYGAQMFPNLARPDVAATRAQLKATTLGLARSLVNDERLSDADRRAANEVMVSGGLGESLPGAQAKLASLIALSAYRQKFANTVRTGGEPLPPLDGAMLGRLVDEKAISPRVAESYAKNVLRHTSQAPNGVIPGVETPGANAPAPQPTGGGEPVFAVNPETGKRLQLIDGQWVPAQ